MECVSAGAAMREGRVTAVAIRAQFRRDLVDRQHEDCRWCDMARQLAMTEEERRGE